MPIRPPARRFEATEKTIHRDLQASMRALEASSLKVPPPNLLDEKQTEASITFVRKAQSYTISCQRWGHYLDNLRACERVIYYLYRAASEYGVSSGEKLDIVDRVFGGLKALPGSTDWAAVLGVEEDATEEQVKDAYRRISKVAHPDAGGTHEHWARVTAAYQYGMKLVKTTSRPTVGAA